MNREETAAILWGRCAASHNAWVSDRMHSAWRRRNLRRGYYVERAITPHGEFAITYIAIVGRERGLPHFFVIRWNDQRVRITKNEGRSARTILRATDEALVELRLLGFC